MQAIKDPVIALWKVDKGSFIVILPITTYKEKIVEMINNGNNKESTRKQKRKP